MNKHQGPSGLPSRPYIPNAPAGSLAPPLPAGPPPAQHHQQQAYGQAAAQPQIQDPAAHAAAWAAYYQAQGVAPGAAYGAPAQPAAAAAGTANPYANYGYGAGAQHASTYQQGAQPAHAVAGPSQPFRPPPNTQAYATAATQPSLGAYGQQPAAAQYGQQAQVYSPQGAAGYSTPQPHAQARPPYQAVQQQQGHAWGTPQGPAQPQQAYRPPQPQAQAQGYQAPQAGPYYPQQQQQAYSAPTQPFRPPTTPQAMQSHSPYRPPPLHQHRPPRPPMSTPPHPSGQGFPPAKRPRFDGPGGNMNGQPGVGINNVRPPLGPAMQNQSPIRPPTAPAAFGVGTNNGQPGFNAGVGVATGPRNGGVVGQGRGGAPVPVSRPPIHLGSGGPPPQLGFGAVRGVGVNAVRGGLASRGRGGGPINAPRGPSGMRRPDARSSVPPSKKDSNKDKTKDRKKEIESKTTMTDFRIVGIEVKELGWSWGKIDGGDEAEVKDAVEKSADVGEEVKPEAEEAETGVTEPEKQESTAVDAAQDEQTQAVVEAEEPAKAESGTEESADAKDQTVKLESVDEPNGDAAATTADAEAVEEKRGEKRKAKSPDAEDEISSKKRPPYLLTHNKPNHTSSPTPTAETGSGSGSGTFESNQNRFRIYFDSPPELDRIPKAERKNASQAQNQNPNPHKRGRRESSSIAPSRAGDAEAEPENKDGVLAENTEQVVAEGEGAAETAESNGHEADDQPIAQAEETSPVTEEVTTAAPSDLVESVQIVSVETVAVENDGASAAIDEAVNTTVSVEAFPTQSVVEVEQAEEHVTEKETPVAAEEEAGDVSMLTDPGPVTIEGEEVLEEVPINTEAILARTPPSSMGELPTATEHTDTPAPEADLATVEVHVESNGHGTSHLPAETSTEDVTTSLEESAEISGSPKGTRSRRQSSVSTSEVGSQYQPTLVGDASAIAGTAGEATTDTATTAATSTDVGKGVPSTNRLSILYERSSRRICVDSDMVEKVRIWRSEGRIEVELKVSTDTPKVEGDEQSQELPKGILIESYDTTDQRFVSLTRVQLSSLHSASIHGSQDAATVDKVEEEVAETASRESDSIPPFHRVFSASSSNVEANGDEKAQTNGHGSAHGIGVTLTVHLNKKNPLSEPKWCRTNGADGWLFEQFGLGAGKNGWVGKLEVMDPDPAPTLKSMLESWASSATAGSPSSRRTFTSSLLSSPLDTLEILLRLTRGERNPPFSTSSPSATSSSSVLAGSLRPDSPYTNHQTHVSLAVLAMYRLTTDLAERVGEKEKGIIEEKVADIVRSLPPGLISRSLDGMWREWNAVQPKA